MIFELGLHLADDLVLQEGAGAHIGCSRHQYQWNEGEDQEGPDKRACQAPLVTSSAEWYSRSGLLSESHDSLGELPDLFTVQDATDLVRETVRIQRLAKEAIEASVLGFPHLLDARLRGDGNDWN